MRSFLLAAAILLFTHDNGFACTCLPAKSPTDELGRSSAVFSGKVVEIKRHQEGKDLFATVEAVFEVKRAWKGVDKKTVSVFTSSHSSACGFGFRRDESYLVYASEGREGKLITSICSRTRTLKDAGDDLKELGEGKEVVAARRDRQPELRPRSQVLGGVEPTPHSASASLRRSISPSR